MFDGSVVHFVLLLELRPGARMLLVVHKAALNPGWLVHVSPFPDWVNLV